MMSLWIERFRSLPTPLLMLHVVGEFPGGAVEESK